MHLQPTKLYKLLRISVIATLSFMAAWGILLVLAQIKPFWVDEWRVIYNLKYKDAASLWGQLDFMQQFPRAYLELIKAFTAPFDYSYFTLRLPAYLTGIAVIIAMWRLMKKIYPGNNINKFLFVMILISSYTFTEYFVQIKQYTMDILMSVAAIWQYAELLRLDNVATVNKKRYVLLCASMFVCPFFSYTYPIAIAPAYMIIGAQIFSTWKSGATTAKQLLIECLPLILGLTGIAIFYVADASQVLHDQGMQGFWGHIIMKHGFNPAQFFSCLYYLFSQVGSGLVFNILFGILGIVSFLFSLYICAHTLMANNGIQHIRFVLYGTVLLLITLILFAAGKLPLGEPRLNAYTVPAISILIIHFLDALRQHIHIRKFSLALSAVLYLGVMGNIYTTSYASISGPKYAHKLDIYVATENAIILAQAKGLPIFITPEVAFPYDKTRNYPYNNTVPGDWVLKTFPAYKVYNHIPVYNVRNIAEVRKCMQSLPSGINYVMAGDGSSFHIVTRE